MILRLLTLTIQLTAFATIIYLFIGVFNKKKKNIERGELLNDHNEKLEDKNFKLQLGGKSNEQK
jgi:hypothetical protein